MGCMKYMPASSRTSLLKSSSVFVNKEASKKIPSRGTTVALLSLARPSLLIAMSVSTVFKNYGKLRLSLPGILKPSIWISRMKLLSVKVESLLHLFLPVLIIILEPVPVFLLIILVKTQDLLIILRSICKAKNTLKFGTITGSIATCFTTMELMWKDSVGTRCTWQDFKTHQNYPEVIRLHL